MKETPVRKPRVVMRDWAVVEIGDVYTPPELRAAVLRGVAVNHPQCSGREECRKNGHRCRTSPIIAAIGREVETRNTIYVLDGPPEPEYMAWLAANGMAYDPEQPVKVRRGV